MGPFLKESETMLAILLGSLLEARERAPNRSLTAVRLRPGHR
jgi:hypothetical protein